MNRNASGTGKMTDAVLSRKLGHYQRLASRCLAVGLIGVIGGIVSFLRCGTLLCGRSLWRCCFSVGSAARSFSAEARRRS